MNPSARISPSPFQIPAIVQPSPTDTATQSDRVSKQTRFEMAKSAPVDSLPDILNDASLRSYQEKLTDLRRQSAELTATYKPEYSKVQRIQAQIAPVEAALEKARQAIVARIGNEYDEARRKESCAAGRTHARLIGDVAELLPTREQCLELVVA